MSSSLLIVAALYELMSKGNSLFAEKTNLDVCSSSNSQAFQNIYAYSSDSSMSIAAEKQSQYLDRIISRLPTTFPAIFSSNSCRKTVKSGWQKRRSATIK